MLISMTGRATTSRARTKSSPKRAKNSSSPRVIAAGSLTPTIRKSEHASKVARSGKPAVAKTPFPRKILDRARELASQYQLVLTPNSEVGYFGRTLELPMAMGDGPDIASCAKSVLEAAVAGIATMLEAGETPPRPAKEGKRDQQVNIRLTIEERLALESAASRAGFRTVSDFVRSAALDAG